ncbi:MAG: Hdr-like menaquinol oxidoreductase cytochrome c subunit [Alphaproteobacteria bacterium]|nr:MAG: Hdr-like menaquinol oxidoreductase cytochrome c subunit [Alphaproteobacteria bacterium]
MPHLLALIALPVLLAAAASAGQDRALWPEVPKAIGTPHPEGNEYWRRHHPDLLRHDRDLTLRMGDRTVRASLRQCLVCHAVTGPDARPVAAGDPGGFCAVCHEYAAVSIDCFTCHKATPDARGLRVIEKARAMGNTPETATMIADYLEALQKGTAFAPQPEATE